MDRRSFLAALAGAGVSGGCLSAGVTETTRPPVSIEGPPIQPPVTRDSLALDPGTLWTKPGLRYIDGQTTAEHDPENGVWGYAEVAIRNVDTEPAAKPAVDDFRLVSGRRSFAPVDALEIDWESLRQRDPRFGRTGYADPASETIDPTQVAYCGLLFDFEVAASPALYWARGDGVTVAFSRVDRR